MFNITRKNHLLIHVWRKRRLVCGKRDVMIRMRKMRSGTRRLFIICLLGLGLILFYYSSTRENENIPTPAQLSTDTLSLPELSPDAVVPRLKIIGQDSRDTQHVSLFKNSSSTCNIPKLTVNNAEVSKFFSKAKPLECKGEALWLEVDPTNKLILTEYAVNKGITEENLNCSVHFYDRINDNTLNWTSIKSAKVGQSVDIAENFLVNCTHNGKIWKHLYMNLAPKKEFSEKASKVQHKASWSGLDVFFLGFDSLSQQAFRRNLPLATEYLEKEMGSVVLNGYNIVGDGTPQAFIPILTSKTEEELPLTRKRYQNANFVDVYPWIWRNFSDAGYVTLYGEDAAAIGTFTYRLKGFKKQPTDHYTRTFFQFAEKFEKKWQCSGPIPQHKVWFKYAEDFMKKYPRDVSKFLLMHHALLSHDDLNDIQNADVDLKDLLKGLNDGGYFKDTLVIVMADHGHRFSKLRATQQGQLEERLPFFSVYLPPAFRETEHGAKMHEHLKANADRLTSPFDIYSTLFDVLRLPSEQGLEHAQSVEKRSLSLFREIPKGRTCEDAGIAPHWCTCLAWKPAYDTEEAQETSNILAKSVVQAINSFTSPERKLCAELRLTDVLDSKRLTPDESLLQYSGVKDQDGFVPDLKGNATASNSIYQIRFKTSPGNALYDATVQHDIVANEITIDFRSISHINKFGDAPHCIIDKNYFLATYCVCYDKIDQ